MKILKHLFMASSLMLGFAQAADNPKLDPVFKVTAGGHSASTLFDRTVAVVAYSTVGAGHPAGEGGGAGAGGGGHAAPYAAEAGEGQALTPEEKALLVNNLNALSTTRMICEHKKTYQTWNFEDEDEAAPVGRFAYAWSYVTAPVKFVWNSYHDGVDLSKYVFAAADDFAIWWDEPSGFDPAPALAFMNGFLSSRGISDLLNQQIDNMLEQGIEWGLHRTNALPLLLDGIFGGMAFDAIEGSLRGMITPHVMAIDGVTTAIDTARQINVLRDLYTKASFIYNMANSKMMGMALLLRYIRCNPGLVPFLSKKAGDAVRTGVKRVGEHFTDEHSPSQQALLGAASEFLGVAANNTTRETLLGLIRGLEERGAFGAARDYIKKMAPGGVASAAKAGSLLLEEVNYDTDAAAMNALTKAGGAGAFETAGYNLFVAMRQQNPLKTEFRRLFKHVLREVTYATGADGHVATLAVAGLRAHVLPESLVTAYSYKDRGLEMVQTCGAATGEILALVIRTWTEPAAATEPRPARA